MGSSRSNKQIQFSLDAFAILLADLEDELKSKGSLSNSDWWRYHYFKNPYLTGATWDELSERFQDIFKNQWDLNEKSQLIPCSTLNNDYSFLARFGHCVEEWNSRGGLPVDLVKDFRPLFANYFKPEYAKVLAACRKLPSPTQPILVKYSKKEFLTPMLTHGKVRVCPASYYEDASHNDAIRDSEIARTFVAPTFRERLRGESGFEFEGKNVFFGDRDYRITVRSDDYYLYSLCNDIYYRLPADFDADAAIVIRDPQKFTQRIISAFLALDSEWLPHSSNVTYYDPHNDVKLANHPSRIKHLRYSYQREHRVSFLRNSQRTTPLEPIFLEIGRLDNIAEIVEFQ